MTMNDPVKILLVCDDHETSETIAALLAGFDDIVVAGKSRSSTAERAAASPEVQAIWIDLYPAPVQALSTLATLVHRYPEKTHWVSARDLDPDLMRTAFRLGALEYLHHDSLKEELPLALERRHQARPRYHGPPSGKNTKKTTLKTLLVSDDAPTRIKRIEDLLRKRKDIAIAGTVCIDEALEKIGFLQPRLVWIDLSPDPDRSLPLIKRARDLLPQTNIFVSYDYPDPVLIKKAYDLGAADFLDPERWKTDLPAALVPILPQAKPESIWWSLLRRLLGSS